MFHRDTFRLIKKTFKRFITILLIVLIGVGFMVGLMSSAPTMRVSVDKYFDDTNFMDIQLFSSYGFDDRDVDALMWKMYTPQNLWMCLQRMANPP